VVPFFLDSLLLPSTKKMKNRSGIRSHRKGRVPVLHLLGVDDPEDAPAQPCSMIGCSDFRMMPRMSVSEAMENNAGDKSTDLPIFTPPSLFTLNYLRFVQ
jgi:hypothetical protein